MTHTLSHHISTQTGITGYSFHIVQNERIVGRMYSSGTLSLWPGFRHDGASGPAIDSPQNLDPSRYHDALYWAMREGILPRSYRGKVDRLFFRLMLPKRPHDILGCMLYFPRVIRAIYHYWAVHRFGWLFVTLAILGCTNHAQREACYAATRAQFHLQAEQCETVDCIDELSAKELENLGACP